jgi:hypothetical protein
MIDVILCGSLCLPGMLHYNPYMAIHGLTIGTLSVLGDGLQIPRFLFWDRVGAVSTFIIWFSYGISLIPNMSLTFMIYEIVIVATSLYWQRIAFSYFYYKNNNRKGLFYQRLWHIGAVTSMTSLVAYDYLFVANRYPHLLFF